MARKKSNMTPVWVTLVILFLIVGIIVGGQYFSAGETGTTGGVTTNTGTNIVCSGEVTPSLTVSAYDFENEGSAITETFIYRKIGDKVWSTGTTGTALTGLIVGANYEFVPGINTSDETDNAYGEMFTYTVQCVEDDSVEIPMYNDEIETSLTATFYNNDNNAAAETFSAGDEQIVSIKLKSGSDEYFGNPTLANPNVLVLKLNSSEWDVPNKVYLADGTELKRVDVPLRYDSLVVSSFTQYAYELPAISDIETRIYLDLNADDTNAPSVDGTAYIYAGGYFITDIATIDVGIEDEDGNAVGTDAPDSVTLDFTA